MKLHVPYSETDVTDAEGAELKNRLQSGDRSAIPVVIEKFTRSAITAVMRLHAYNKREIRDEEDVEAQMLYAMVVACNKVIDGHDSTLERDMWKIIYNEVFQNVQKYVREDYIIRVPQTAQVNNQIKPPKRAGLQDQPSRDKAKALREDIDECANDDMDARIIDLKIQGYTLSEIGEQLSVSAVAISKRLKKIRSRYHEKH